MRYFSIIILAIVLLTISMVFNAGLNISSLQKMYERSSNSLYELNLQDIKYKLENSLRFGKSLEKYVGLGQLENDVKKLFPEINDISIYDLEGKAFAFNNTPLKTLPLESFLVEGTILKSIIGDKQYFCTKLIVGFKKVPKGYVCISLASSIVKEKTYSFLWWNIYLVFFLLVLVSFILFFLISYLNRNSKINFDYKVLIRYVLIVLALTQIIYTAIVLKQFYFEYNNSIDVKSQKLLQILKEDIDPLLEKGIAIDKLVNIEKSMSKVLESSLEFKKIVIVDKYERLLYTTFDKDQEAIFYRDNFRYIVALETRGFDGKITHGFLAIEYNKPYIIQKLKSLVFDTLTIIIVSLIFTYELVYLLIVFYRGNGSKTSSMIKSKVQLVPYYYLARPLIFIFMFAFDLCLSFLPLYMGELYTPKYGISLELSMGLPISSEMFTAALAMILGAIYCERYAWHYQFIFGVILVSIGSFFSGLTLGMLEFIFYRALVGFGYGLVLVSLQDFIIKSTKTKNRTYGFAMLFAGLYAGSISGGAGGSILAEIIPYDMVFFTSAFIVLLSLLILPLLITKTGHDKRHEASPKIINKQVNWLMFLSNKKILLLLFTVALPSATVTVGFMYYFTPIFMNGIGAEQSDIGRLFMLNGMILIYIAPYLSNKIDKLKNKVPIIITSGLFYMASLISFSFIENSYMAITISIVLLSLGASLGMGTSMTFAASLEITKEFGQSKGMGIIRSIERAGQVIGPLVFATMIGVFGITQGLGVIGFTYMVLVLVFIILMKNEKRLN